MEAISHHRWRAGWSGKSRDMASFGQFHIGCDNPCAVVHPIRSHIMHVLVAKIPDDKLHVLALFTFHNDDS